MPAIPNWLLWAMCVWWLMRAGYWTFETIIRIRDAMEAEEHRRRQQR